MAECIATVPCSWVPLESRRAPRWGNGQAHWPQGRTGMEIATRMDANVCTQVYGKDKGTVNVQNEMHVHVPLRNLPP